MHHACTDVPPSLAVFAAPRPLSPPLAISLHLSPRSLLCVCVCVSPRPPYCIPHPERARIRIHSFLEGSTLQANYMTVLSMLTRLRQACDSPELVQSAFTEAEEAAAHVTQPTEEARRCADELAAGRMANCALCSDQVQREGGAATACGHAFCYECILEHLYAGIDGMDAVPARRCPIQGCEHPLVPTKLFKLEALLPQAATGLDTVADDGEAAAAAPSLSASSSGRGAGTGRGTGSDAPKARASTKTQMVLEAISAMRADDPSAKCLVFSSYARYLDVLEPHLTSAKCGYARIDGSQPVKKREEQVWHTHTLIRSNAPPALLPSLPAPHNVLIVLARHVGTAQLDAFHTEGISVLLMSLKCGVGLNLTCATTVILTEPWWNPFVEEQAIDRTHRIGQTKPVRVLRLAISDTVEERILGLQDRKRELSAHALSDHAEADQPSAGAATAQLHESDFLSIFGLSADVTGEVGTSDQSDASSDDEGSGDEERGAGTPDLQGVDDHLDGGTDA